MATINGTTNAPEVNVSVSGLDAVYEPINANAGQSIQSNGLVPEIKNNGNVPVRVTLNPVATGNVTLLYAGFNGYNGQPVVELQPTQSAKIAYQASVPELPVGGLDESWSIDFAPSVEYFDATTSDWVAV